MKLRRLIPLCLWLSTILLMAAGAASSEWWNFTFPPALRCLVSMRTLGNALLQGDNTQTARPATPGAQPDAERGCFGAACCGTGHGCCVATLPSSDEPASPPAGNPLAMVLAGDP